MTESLYDIDKAAIEQEVNKERDAELTELETIYGKQNADGTYTGGSIGSVEDFYKNQIDAANEWGAEQAKNQQAQTDFAIEKIEQQKAQAEKDYTKEQSGAYTDWQKQSNKYGANAEAMAAQGLANGGYAESSQVSMYNTYQMRVTAARESFERAKLNYDNSIQEAKLQNNSRLAEIAYQTLQKSLELSLQGFQYKNQLIAELTKQKQEIKNNYYNRYLAELEQINAENTLKETVRRNNAEIELARDRFNEEVRQFNQLHPEVPITSQYKANTNYKLSNKNTKKKITNDEKKLDKTNKKTSSSKVSGSKGATVDMKSVLDLGFGPISEKRLNELVQSGVVQEYESNGKIKFKKSPYAQKQFSVLK